MLTAKVKTSNRDGEKLMGIRTQPDTDESKYPTIVLIHGFGVTKEQKGMFVQLTEYYASAGFLSYRFDFSGCGESEGDFSNTSLSKQCNDLSSILDFVKSEPNVDISRIGLHAQSFGTCVAVALHPLIKTAILMGSIADPEKYLSIMFGQGYNPQGISRVNRSDGTVTVIKPYFWDDLKKYNLKAMIKKIHYPVLFIHAQEDESIPLSEMEAYFNVKEGVKEKVVIEGANHKMLPGIKKMYPFALNWFNRYLK